MKLLSVSTLLVVLPALTHAWSNYIQRIPNGDNVVGPDGESWVAVGHQAPAKGAPLNAFGVDFKAAGLQWTVDLCLLDSDGDGRTNGQELGDPTCVWSVGETPTVVENITHPGLFNKEFGVEVDPATEEQIEQLQLPSWLQAHIACMMLSWGFLLPIGALMAISFRHSFANKALWFQLHIGIQVLGIVLNIVGIVIAFVNIALHFQTTHSILGTVVFAMGILQAVQGFIRPAKPASNNEKPSMLRRVWEVCHKGFGRIVIVLAWTNTFLGIRLIQKRLDGIDGNDRIMTACIAMFAVQIALCVILTAVSLFYKSKPKEVEGKDQDKVDEINETSHMGSNDSGSDELQV